MKKFYALVQIFLIVMMVGYGTFQLFEGNFEAAFGTLPLLMFYYVFVTARQRRARSREEREESDV